MNVMKKAWTIAKEGAAKFGGKVKEYFAESLKLAWAITKNEVDAVGGFDTESVIVGATDKKMEYALVGIPNDVEVTVMEENHIRTANRTAKGHNGVTYNLYKIMIDFNFKVVVNGVTHFFKVAKNGKLYFNGKK